MKIFQKFLIILPSLLADKVQYKLTLVGSSSLVLPSDECMGWACPKAEEHRFALSAAAARAPLQTYFARKRFRPFSRQEKRDGHRRKNVGKRAGKIEKRKKNTRNVRETFFGEVRIKSNMCDQLKDHCKMLATATPSPGGITVKEAPDHKLNDNSE